MAQPHFSTFKNQVKIRPGQSLGFQTGKGSAGSRNSTTVASNAAIHQAIHRYYDLGMHAEKLLTGAVKTQRQTLVQHASLDLDGEKVSVLSPV